MKISGLQIAEGEVMPWWHGIAYYSPYSDHIISYPLPINYIVRWARNFWWLFKTSGKKDALRKAYEAGYSKGIGEHRYAVETINSMIPRPRERT